MEIVSSVMLLALTGCALAKLAVSMAKEDMRREHESENAWLEWERANGHFYY